MSEHEGAPPPYEPKLVHLPGTVLTPEVVLHRTLAKLPHIKGVVVVIQWQDDSMDVDWSQLRTDTLCMTAMVLDDQARKVLRGEG